ncbi:MAG: DUF3604 domain-containing protein [Deltaproteobacteria bacterium]|nr:DUF3604 domain-containing protein [Deltaproteobacteria bacterium]
MRRKTIIGIIAIFLLGSVLLVSGAWAKDPVGEPGRDSKKPNPLKNLYFGEQHMHTRNSFDAFTIGVTQTWEQAYRFGRGEEVTLNTNGIKMKRRTPYDFVAITDHAEYYGVLKDLPNPKNPLSKTPIGKELMKARTDPAAAKAAVTTLIGSMGKGEPIKEYVTPELRVHYWDKFVATANKFNDPGKFTAMISFEWTSNWQSVNMHRNVFFKNKPPLTPFSSFDSYLPEDLWTYLETQRTAGIETFAIPHNGNLSDGWMYSPYKYLKGGKIDAQYARRQNLNEPLTEVHQTKGNSEAHPLLSPNDEFAAFEIFPNLINTNTPTAIKHCFIRQGLVDGMSIETRVGTNPYKMGIVAGADCHSGYQNNEEWDFHGSHGKTDDSPQKRLNPAPAAVGTANTLVSSAGATAVWATENTRAGIFEAMKSKETYGTTGTLIRLRFFGGWEYPANLVKDKKFVEKAYKGGVPMGQDLPRKPANVTAPTFAVWATKDPQSGNLDRVQIIKGWAHPATGFPQEKIYDVAWSDNRKPDTKTGKLPPVGNTVDTKKATWKNDIGDTQLSVVWTDPDFDPKMKAVYYVRVLEIPTPRWSTYDSARNNLPLPKDVPATIQERAYSSPIWYTPEQKVAFSAPKHLIPNQAK